MFKKRRKRRSEAALDSGAKAVIDAVIRRRARERVRDPEGRERIFRSTVLEKEGGDGGQP